VDAWASPALTGNPTAPTATAGDNDTSIATTAFVASAIAAGGGGGGTPATVPPLMDGTAAVGTGTKYAREDHVHPSDTSRQAVDADLTALAALVGTGIARRTAPDTWSIGTLVTNAELAQMPTFTFKGNSTAGLAAPTDITIASLTTKASPGGADFLLISDQAASGAMKKVAISTMPGSAGGITDAPNDGQLYGRQSLGWVAATGTTTPSNALPLMDGTANAGVAVLYARGDHVHPSDTSRQPLDAELTAIAGLVSAADQLPYFTGAGAASLATFTAFGRLLVDDADAATARTTLGLSAVATATPAALTKTDDTNVTITLGGTPATALLQAASITAGWTGTLATGRGGLGADNSASNGVPFFTAGAVTMTGTSGTGSFVRAADPVFTGNPTAPTQAPGDNDASIATTAFVTTAASTAVAKKNYIINGAMMVSQENGSTAGTTLGYFPVDQFQYTGAGSAAVVSTAQVASLTPAGSPTRIRLTVTSPDVTQDAGDFLTVVQAIEGFRFADLKSGTSGAKTITLQFGVKAPAGTYCVAVRNATFNRSYVAEYVIAAGEANTDVVKSVSLQFDTTGTWAKDNTVGAYISWAFICGSTYRTTAGAWTAGNLMGSANQFNFTGTNGNIFELFDVSLTEGSVAPPYQVPDYARELALCQRYFVRLNNEPLGLANTAFSIGVIRYPVPMRGTPTFAIGAFTVNSGSIGSPALAAPAPTATAASLYNGAGNWTVNAQVGCDVMIMNARL
jgi:hypothetical protein